MHHLPTFLTVHFVYTNNIIQCQESMSDIHCQEHNKSQPLQTDSKIIFLRLLMTSHAVLYHQSDGSHE